jgi:hypothetical protein
VEAHHIRVVAVLEVVRSRVAVLEVVRSRVAVLEVVRSRVAVLEVVRSPVVARAAVLEAVLEAGRSRAVGSRRDWGYRPTDRSGRRGALGVGS